MHMAQDPWKRAHQIKRLREQQARDQAHASGRAADHETQRRLSGLGLRRRSLRPAVAAWLMVGILLLGGAAAWYLRDTWLPRLKQEIRDEPEAVRKVVEALPEERVVLDSSAMDSGLGFGLRLDGDYLEMLAHMREQDPGWKVTASGGDTARLTAPGATVKVIGGRIQNYELQLEPLFAADGWNPWLQGLEDAHLSPQLAWTSLTGEKEMPEGASEREISGKSFKRADGWVTPVYILRFSDGYLRSIELAIRFGVAEPGIEAQDAPPPSPDPAARPGG